MDSRRYRCKCTIVHGRCTLTRKSCFTLLQKSRIKNISCPLPMEIKTYCKLYCRWRSKVYQLLVQQKSAEISNKLESTKTEERERSLKGQLWQLQQRLKELEGVVRDREAQISLTTNQIQVRLTWRCHIRAFL